MLPVNRQSLIASEKLNQQWSQAITLLLHYDVYTSECMCTHVTMCTILNNTLTQLANNIQQNHDLFSSVIKLLSGA